MHQNNVGVVAISLFLLELAGAHMLAGELIAILVSII